MSNSKKIVLVIVEGISDKVALEGYLNECCNNGKVHFQCLNCDITSDYNSNTTNIIEKVDKKIKEYIKATRGIVKKDIVEIIHIVDIDGCFLPDDCVINDESYSKTYYDDSKIYCIDNKAIIERNERKRANISRLISCGDINKINYKVYYFSYNLDHVLHDDPNIPYDEKLDRVGDFHDQYGEELNDFFIFLENENLCMHDEYIKSWEMLKSNVKMLRCTNINIALEYLCTLE